MLVKSSPRLTLDVVQVEVSPTIWNFLILLFLFFPLNEQTYQITICDNNRKYNALIYQNVLKTAEIDW